jgi:TRAP-type C4-dicarboxylate transport system substrate-binding protein
LLTAVTFKAYEVTKYLSLTRHVYNAGALMVGKPRWDQMTEEDRAAFEGAAKDVLPFWRQSIATASQAGERFCKERGMEVVTADFHAFQDKMKPVYDQFSPKYKELFDLIKSQQ